MTIRPATLVISALREELAPLAKKLGLTAPAEAQDPVSNDEGVSLAVTGSGGSAAAAGLSRLLAHHRFESVLGIGLAGALTADLEVGDLVRAATVRTPERILWEAGDGETPSSAGRGDAGPRSGVVVSSTTILSSAAAKGRLAASVGAISPTVVDLESAAWVVAASEASIRIDIVRAVSDRLDEDLPLDFELFRDQSGRLEEQRVVRHALTRPRAWRPLVQLRGRLRLCAERLAAAVFRELAR